MWSEVNVVLVGEGGHSKVIREIINARSDYRIVAILDDKYDELLMNEDMYVGPISSAAQLAEQVNALNWVVAIGNNSIRKSIIARLDIPNEHYLTLIHETAVISSSASIAQGTVIMANTVINADAKIGYHAIINTGAIVEHDCQLADYVHIAPRATLTGAVVIQEGTMIGAGATIIPGKHIGEWTLVGAGATVIHNIPSYQTAVGTPATVLPSKT
ncbi:acetyltransferase [Paenibacillus pectinilyticus]|uniref:Acetyltransferase n=1 Tax=Paenibacillus pectinilyticus TaxID=512399 RepID=A0A1C0ZSH7_9BACL|nr:acetyltransferase [Paenibacillus pectinilyticus]OCT11034.1 acetyltransferase [Paenibacillus pectinilyticus]